MGRVSSRSYLVEQPRDPSRPWAPSPFNRLARTHALSVAGDAVFTTAMAGLVFFSVTNLSQARWRVAAALLFTIVPLSLAAPFIGPLIDRAQGGRKWMIFGLSLGRAFVCLLLVFDRDNQLLLYPEFTVVLVCSQGYVLARSALVPTTVRGDTELVEANSKLAAISGVSAVAGGLVAVIVLWTMSKTGSDLGPNVALAVAAVVYMASAIQAAQLPPVRVAAAPADVAETTELHSYSIRYGAVAISVSRVAVGFLTFMLAFHFKDLEETDSWGSKAGLIGSIVGAEIGFLVGAAVAPRIRKVMSEEQIIMVSLAVTVVAGLLTALMGDIPGAILLALAIGLTSNSAKQSFDAIIQRDAPDANRGRAFAKFETRFQLWWVVGALVPVVLTVPLHLGFLLIAVISAAGLAWYAVRLRRAAAEARRRPSPLDAEPVLVEPRPVSRSFIRGRRQTRNMGFAADDPTLIGSLPSGVGAAVTTPDPTIVAGVLDPAAVPSSVGPDGEPSVAAEGDPAARLRALDAPGGPFLIESPEYRAANTPPPGLFGPSDTPISAGLGGAPAGGLFALSDAEGERDPRGDRDGAVDHDPAAPHGDERSGDPAVPGAPMSVGAEQIGTAPAAAGGPILYDSEAWLAEDEFTGERPAAIVGGWDDTPTWRDPGPPSLVPPADPPAPLAPPPATTTTTTTITTDVVVPLAPAGVDGDQLTLVSPDGTYPEPVWRDAVTPPLPGFEPPN